MAGEIPGHGPDWKGLLKWSLANTDGLQMAPPREISEEDRKWFNDAVQAHSVDVIRRMKEISVVLNTPQQVLDEQGVTVEELEGMLEELQEHVESIDMANDLHAIGGLIPLLKYLKHPHSSIRARAAEVVSTIVQNNPKSQQQVLDVKGLQLLVENFTADEDLNVRAKALGAISSLIRHNKAGGNAFRLGNGYRGLRDALSSDHLRLQRKALQVILYLLQEYPKDAKVVGDLGLTRVLAKLVSSPDGDMRETSLNVLVQMGKNGQLKAVADSSAQLKQILTGRIDELTQCSPENIGAAKEESFLIDALWQSCYNEPSTLRQSGLLGSWDNDEKEALDILSSSGNLPSEDSSQTVEKPVEAPLMILGPS